MEAAVQLENSHANAAVPGLHRVPGVPGPGFQKRIDKLVAQRWERDQQILELREENRELKGLLLQYENVIERYKSELRKMRRQPSV